MNPIVLRGKVVKGKNRGVGLGFPTANINLHRKTPEGIYISNTKIRSKSYPSLTFIGAAKTFGEKEILAETYFLSNIGNIYGKWLTIKLIKKIRNNQKFNSEKDLIMQMEKDKKEAQEYFKI